MNKMLRTFSVVLIAVLLLAGSLQLAPALAQDQVEPVTGEMRTVTVTGAGSVSVQPDIAVVSVGVRTEAEQASEALEQNNQQMADLIDALQGAGIAEEDIQTQYINLSPRYADQPDMAGQPQVTGYIATNTVQVRIENIDQVGQTLDTVVQAGGNLIENIRFQVSEQQDLLDQAREAAFQNAQQKAEQLAGLAGAELGMVVSISETGGGPVVPFAAGGQDFAAAVPVEPGQQEVQVIVQVMWELVEGEQGQ